MLWVLPAEKPQVSGWIVLCLDWWSVFLFGGV
jgi:hypothetical protein